MPKKRFQRFAAIVTWLRSLADYHPYAVSVHSLTHQPNAHWHEEPPHIEEQGSKMTKREPRIGESATANTDRMADSPAVSSA